MKAAILESKATKAPSQVKRNPSERWLGRRADIIAALSLCAIGALVYGTFLRSVGFYWDDWPVIWVDSALGKQGVLQYFSGDRPFTGLLYSKFEPFLGISPLGWQAVNDVVRSIASVVVYFLFRGLWPKRKDVAWLVAAFVLLYPGFTQQAIAFSYLPHNFSFLLFASSLVLTVVALKQPRFQWPLLLASMICGVWSYLIMEYFVGLEFMRIVIIWIRISGEGHLRRDKIRESLLRWSPYAAAWVGFIVWRSFIFHEVHYHPIADKNVPYLISRALHNPVKELGTLALNAIHNITMGIVYAFLRPFETGAISPKGGAALLSWAIGFVIVAISLYALRLTTSSSLTKVVEDSPEESLKFLWGGVAMSIVGACLAGLPFISGQSTFFAPILSFGDRFALPFMLPGSIALACFLAWGLKRVRSRMLVAGVLLFAFSVFQLKCMNSYRHDWQGQKSLFWQLAWRFPNMKPGTTVFVDGLSESIGSGESLGLLDLLYKPRESDGKLDYILFDMRRVPDGKPSFTPSSTISRHLRSYRLMGNTSESVVAWLSPEGTLRVISPRTAGEVVQGSMLSTSVAQISHPEEITTGTQGLPAGPLLKLFGPEPRHEWQYFYQKAELKRQLQDWDAVASLGDDALKQGYEPTDASEWFPFVDGYAHAHRFRTAQELTKRVLRSSPESVSALSSLWQRCSRECSPRSEELTNALSDLSTDLMLKTAP